MISALLTLLGTNLLLLILHIQNYSSFPKPLSAKQEREYLERMAGGDTQARDILIERNLRLVSHIVKKYYSKTNDADELISIGTIGLIKGIDSFDYTKGTKLATYASRCIENELLMHFRSLKKESGDVLMGDAVDTDSDGNPLTVEDTLADEHDLAEAYEKKAQWAQVKRYIETMPNERDRTVLILRYGLNNQKPLTQREVAAKLGISRSYISRIETRLLKDIRDRFQ
ncbi:MAG: RNA polymerase sporulation sigma factor SigK [Eubacterium sp.]|nr:RNA polymerase sporulation sigma factor SigK [Eubacterium sp.]